MQKKVQKTIEKYNMLKSGDKVVIGVSGGPDSLVLLHVLVHLKAIWNLELMVAHFNHMLREEAAGEAAFVSAFAEQLGLPVTIGEGDVAQYAEEWGLSTQTAARELRYGFLKRIASETRSQKIALAHQLDDQAETIVMHFLRGPSPRGLAGIPPVRDKIIRPLIEITRQEIEDYIKAHGLNPVSDSSNYEKVYLRNRVRLELMPTLKEYNPNLATRLVRAAELFRDEDRYLEEETARQLTRLCSRGQSGELFLNYSGYQELPLAIKRRLLRQCFLEIASYTDSRELGFEQVERVLTWLAVPERGKSLEWPEGIRLSFCQNKIIISKNQIKPKQSDFLLQLPTSGTVEVPGGSFVVEWLSQRLATETRIKDCSRWEALVDGEKVTFPLTIRNRRPGDRFYPLGAGGSKKLKDFFIDLKLPRQIRSQIPLVVSATGEIIWVAGCRLDERFKVTEATDKVLHLSYVPKKVEYEIV